MTAPAIPSARDYRTTGQSEAKPTAERRTARPEHRSRRGRWFSHPGPGYRQRQAGRRPGAELAADREAVSACLDFLMAAITCGAQARV